MRAVSAVAMRQASKPITSKVVFAFLRAPLMPESDMEPERGNFSS